MNAAADGSERLRALAAQASHLRALHHAAEPLVLPNAWDAATASAVVEAGFPVVATTSSGMSAALGYADGEHTPADEMFWALGRICRVVAVPVTADIEAGYGLSPEALVSRLLDTGVVGCNLEDTDHARARSLRDANEQVERLRAFKGAARRAGVDIVLNARVDVFLRAGGQQPEALAEAIRRGRLYIEAGADCVFPIGVPDETCITALVEAVPGPINVIPGFHGAPNLARLRELGVRRVSYAGRLHRAMLSDHQQRLETIKHWQDI